MRLSTAIAAASVEDDICRSVVQGLQDESLGYNFVGIFLIDMTTGDREMKASVGWSDIPPGMRIPRGQGLSYRAIASGRLHYTPDVREEPEYVPGLGTGSEVDVPVMLDGTPIGVLVVESEAPEAFGKADFEILTAAANQASIAVARARLVATQEKLLATERRRGEEQRALLETMADLSAELELNRLLQAVLERAASLLGATAGELAVFEEDRRELVIAANYRVSPPTTAVRLRMGEGAMGQVAKTGKPLLITDYQEWTGRSEQYATVDAHAVIVSPLLVGGRLVGAFSLWTSDVSRVFGDDDLRLLNLFGPQAAVAIENARLFAEAERERQYFTELVRNSPVAIVALDVDHRIVSCNPAFEDLYGYAEQEIAGRNLDELITTAETRAEAIQYTEQAGDGAVQGVSRRRRKDGTMVDVEVLAVPVVVNGERVGMMGLYHDITAMLKARREAEAANDAKSQFLASMSHELRTPLNAILGYSEMLQEDAADVGQDAFVPDLQKIHGAGRHLLALINDVLDLSKIEAGKMELYLETFEVRSVVDTVATTVAPLVAKHANRLELDLREGLGTMRSDMTRVRQVLLNLLSNASKFTERGTVTLRARRENGETLVFEVEDTGIGMNDEQLGKLFKAFSQAEVSTSSKYGGTGLGLAISKKFCEMMGGEVAVRSAPGVGTTFTVRLPASVAEAANVAASPVVAAGDEGSGVVLVVDDDPAVRALMRRYLAKDGFQVVEAANGRDGLRVAREHRPDVITLDVLMPGMDGWAVLSALKSDPDLSDVPVVMVTIVDEKNMGFALGASDYLTKPIDRKRLAQVLKRYGRRDHRQVLVVEDDEGTREALRRTLSTEGWDVIEAENGRVALEQMAATTPSLVLLDLVMPEMDGFEFVEALRDHAEWETIPVVVITSKDLTLDEHRRLNGGVERVVQKGGRRAESLVAEVRELIHAHSAGVA